MKRLVGIAVVTMLAGVMVALPAWAVSLDLDARFGTQGVQQFSLDRGSATSIGKDGLQILAAGTYVGPEDNTRLFVARMHRNGSPVAKFGVDGVASAPAPGQRSGVGMEVLDDGSVLTAYTRETGIMVNKWTPDGELDTAFSSDGTRLVPMPVSRPFPSPKIEVDTRGRPVVAAMVEAAEGTNAVVARLLPGGATDSSLSGNGRVTINLGKWDWADALATDANNRILLGSDQYQAKGRGFPDYGVVVRLRANGDLDNSFSGNGVVRFRMLRDGVNYPVDIGVTASGVITVAAVAGGQAYGAVRLRSDGTLDDNYGHDGVLSLNCECEIYIGSVGVQRVAFAGVKGYDSQSQNYDGTILAMRISADGVSVDRTHLDLLPGTTQEDVRAVRIDGSRTLISGQTGSGPYVARFGRPRR